jgi:hypothetical protein
MRLLESWETLEVKEDRLRQQVNKLSDDKKKAYYKALSHRLKDPDTYASINYFFIGGFHHFYLGKYKIFAIEFTLLVMSILGFIFVHQYAIYLILLIAVYELPQLFFSQKIARQYNYDVSLQLYHELDTCMTSDFEQQ